MPCPDEICNDCTPCSQDCGPAIVPCTDPIYTANNCEIVLQTSCIINNEVIDPCLDIAANSFLSTVLLKFKTYVKNTFTRLTPFDSSISVISTDDTCDDKAKLKVNISTVPNNVITLQADGLHATNSPIAIVQEDTQSINLTGNGLLATPLKGDVIRDTVTGAGNNILQIGVNGVYVPPTAAAPVVTANNALNKVGNNIKLGGPLTEDTVISDTNFSLKIIPNVAIGTLGGDPTPLAPKLAVYKRGPLNSASGNFASVIGLDVDLDGVNGNSTLYAGVAGSLAIYPDITKALLPDTHYSGVVGTTNILSDVAITNGIISAVSAVAIFASKTEGAANTHGVLSGWTGFRVRPPLQDVAAASQAHGGITNVYGLYIENLRSGELGDLIQRSFGIYQVSPVEQNWISGSLKVGAGDVTHPSAKMEINSTSSGFLLPRMTGAQVENISNPAEGLLVYATDGTGAVVTYKGNWYFDGTTWKNCCKVTTTFAVTGNTRTSHIGGLQFFTTLTLANAAAVAGETVLIYNDTLEDLNVKTGVSYQGVGKHSVGNINVLDVNVSNSTNYISHLKANAFTGIAVNVKVFLSDVTITDTSLISSDVKVSGGVFLLPGKNLTINLAGKLSHAFIEGVVDVIDNGTLTNSVVEDKSVASALYAVYVNNTSGSSNTTATVSNCHITSVNNLACGAITVGAFGNTCIVSNNTIRSVNNTALIVHGSTPSTATGKFIVSGNTCSNSGANTLPALLLYQITAPIVDTTQNIIDYFVTNNTGFSINGPGIKSVLGNMKGCSGYSVNSYGIFVDSQENKGNQMCIVDCIGESQYSNGIRATRDIQISGGTYISRLNTASGHPIFISDSSQNGTPAPNLYYVVGVTTIARHPDAWAIQSNVPITAKIAGCKFLNERVSSPVKAVNFVPSVGALITPVPVTIDVYGNIS